MELPCKNCICLAICRSAASSVYKMINHLRIGPDMYAIVAIVERELISPTSVKCKLFYNYTVRDNPQKLYMVDETINLLGYLHLDLAYKFREASEKRDSYYYNHKISRIRKMEKEYNVNDPSM